MPTIRERWSSRFSFVFAAIGSAIGLGNVWRFPYITYQNGGGAFLIPYFVALITAGIPLMILEYYVGQETQRAPPTALKKIWKKSEWIGWFSVCLVFFLSTYYSTIMSWCVNYFYQSFTLGWGSTQEAINNFFNNTLLGKSGSPGILGGIQMPVLIGLAITWISIYLCLFRGVKILGKIVYFTVCIPWLLLIIMVIRGLSLPGAIEGLNFYLTPDFSVLLKPQAWLAAYGQIFYTLSLAMGTLIIYASYLPKDSDITANAFITSLANCGTAFFAGFAVFSTLGYLAQSMGVSVPEVTKSGFGLAFVTYPTVINLLPVASCFFGAFFFLLLLTLGIDSAFSEVEPVVGSIVDKWGLKKKWVLPLVCIFGFLVGILYSTRGGFYWVDLTDHFICNYGITLVGLLECIVIGYVFGARKARSCINEVSDVRIGPWWDVFIKFITPIVLGVSFIMQLIKLIQNGYGNYPIWTIFTGMGFIVLLLILSVILSRRKGVSDE
ncbi:MAG: sodium-dependent transporter [candidate division WOR-3 bacterium]|nr:sodium-dependent transporter [candidate division WOR-3 bacterium]